MAHANQLADWDRAASIVSKVHNAWYKDTITPGDANPIRMSDRKAGSLEDIKPFFKPRQPKATQ